MKKLECMEINVELREMEGFICMTKQENLLVQDKHNGKEFVYE